MYKTIIGAIFMLLLALPTKAEIRVGAEQMERYLPSLVGKRVGIVANQASLVGESHLVDTLCSIGVEIAYIFSPEHGFRGEADAGEKVSSYIDKKSGIEVISLYGSSPSPPDEVMQQLDILIYDLQDVGVRYFTYISTMKYCMEKCATWGKKLIILDRPNPNIALVDGPILEMRHKSFVGLFPIPILYGMTPGELAQMANGEGWLATDGCNLEVVACANYDRDDRYILPIKPSPNLPNILSIYLYPSLCYFEATDISLGRGTTKPFQLYGHPKMKSSYSFSFTPVSSAGAKYPPQQDVICYGVDLSDIPLDEAAQMGVKLEYLIDGYNKSGKSEKYLNSFFEKLIGVSYVREMIISGHSAEEIERRWIDDVKDFKRDREDYLIY